MRRKSDLELVVECRSGTSTAKVKVQSLDVAKGRLYNSRPIVVRVPPILGDVVRVTLTRDCRKIAEWVPGDAGLVVFKKSIKIAAGGIAVPVGLRPR